MTVCEKCLKPEDLCVCGDIHAQQTKTHVLILQHPQEPDKTLGSARMTKLSLPNSTLRVGLSWPNLTKALGTEAGFTPEPSKWAVLYLGSGIKSAKPMQGRTGLIFVNKKGEPLYTPRPQVQGLIVLDGTWSQAKTLWWRNAWLLKLNRVILIPREKSLYRELRREPRAECLSTIESVAESLTALGEPESVEIELKGSFGKLLEKQRGRMRAKKARTAGI